ncbi:hypothetical protein OHA40_17240 [Nocardia sp. NBC_00508]|uniref:hypothetical protein n=1 Tax=Nocardia sp. NBC_00508 TaxID=2975992 RepID=UPI002E810C5F|nr:hypothetical protein [Nocardia sp. NBC_00508]WUD63535.1 hypothetical protein OHA40_17240 [Nocardia sp. NBC_00508]
MFQNIKRQNVLEGISILFAPDTEPVAGRGVARNARTRDTLPPVPKHLPRDRTPRYVGVCADISDIVVSGFGAELAAGDADSM